MRLIKITAAACCLAITGTLSVTAEENDTRTLIKLPSDIKEKMVVIMRDHIRALDDIIDAIQTGEYDKAERIAESRLGWSSSPRLGDQEVIKYWPEPMQKMADQLYHAASNYVVVSRNAAVEDSKGSYQKINAALSEVSSACRGCHETYRLR